MIAPMIKMMPQINAFDFLGASNEVSITRALAFYS
jgi:hypothetical protein